MKFPRPSATLHCEVREFLKLLAIALPMAALLVLITVLLLTHPAVLAAIWVVAVFAIAGWAAFWPVKE